jgi:hypothetical protein
MHGQMKLMHDGPYIIYLPFFRLLPYPSSLYSDLGEEHVHMDLLHYSPNQEPPSMVCG